MDNICENDTYKSIACEGGVGAAARQGYSGTDNLEVMAVAINYNRFLVNLVRRHARWEMQLMDMGAGIGTFARQLNNEFQVSCFEPDRDLATTIRAHGIEAHSDFDKIPSASVDLLYSLNVLEHIKDDVEALRQWRRILRPGAKVLIYVPAMQSLYSSMDAKVGHYRRYSRAELVEKMSLAGYQVEQAEYADSLGALATLAYKWVGQKDGGLNQGAVWLFDRFVFPVGRILDKLALRWVAGKNVWVIASNGVLHRS